MSGHPTAPPGPVFHVHQKVTPFQNTYRVLADQGGQPGALVGFAKQKRLAFRESFTVYADEAMTRPVLAVRADRVLDVRSVMHVTDLTTGEQVGALRKVAAPSILRSTWSLEQPGAPAVEVRERSLAVALLRRVWDLIPYAGDIPVPWVFHFDGTAPGGVPVLTYTRRWGLRDRYVLQLLSPALDARLAIALAICLDAMQHR